MTSNDFPLDSVEILIISAVGVSLLAGIILFIRSTTPTLTMGFFEINVRKAGNKAGKRPPKITSKNLPIILAAVAILFMMVIAGMGYFWLRDRRAKRRTDAAERGQANDPAETPYQRSVRLGVERLSEASRADPSYPLSDVPPAESRRYNTPSYHNPGFNEMITPAPVYIRGQPDRSAQQTTAPSQHPNGTTQQSSRESGQNPAEHRSPAPARKMRPVDRLKQKLSGGTRV
ncbi:hypothetical protein QQX98_002869 [Neonectria punicea]|uniref:Uncharacterized protein n=1 Tax=Neonectria punicea TaxID=979145 RepID=A0ABR1HGB5_9HYPO